MPRQADTSRQSSGVPVPLRAETVSSETLAAGVAKSLIDAPDFLRLGLMLALERRRLKQIT